MARKSFHLNESYLGLAGNPVEWTDPYNLSDPPINGRAEPDRADSPKFVHYASRITDLNPRGQESAPGTHPFPTRFATRNSGLIFNIAAYSKQLVTDFLMRAAKLSGRVSVALGVSAVAPESGHRCDRLWSKNAVERMSPSFPCTGKSPG